jgi:hypothetical protein
MGPRVPAVTELPPHVVRAHEEAVARGDDGYLDPDTGLFVMTATFLAERGFCCGSGCRHCPYSSDEDGEPTLVAAEH